MVLSHFDDNYILKEYNIGEWMAVCVCVGREGNLNHFLSKINYYHGEGTKMCKDATSLLNWHVTYDVLLHP